MYPTDPRQLNTERQIYLDKQFFVDVFSIPACVRNTNGDFIGYNEKFSKEFIGSLDIKEWFYSLPVQVATSFLREDEVEHVLELKEVLKNAPKQKNGFFVTQKVVG